MHILLDFACSSPSLNWLVIDCFMLMGNLYKVIFTYMLIAKDYSTSFISLVATEYPGFFVSGWWAPWSTTNHDKSQIPAKLQTQCRGLVFKTLNIYVPICDIQLIKYSHLSIDCINNSTLWYLSNYIIIRELN